MTLKIRNVMIEDLEAVTDVEARCFPPTQAASRTAFEQRIKDFSQNIFVAEIDGKIIEFINGCVINEKTIHDKLYQDAVQHVPNGDQQTVFGLDVIPEYRNQEIASQLMNHLIAVSRSAGRKGVYSHMQRISDSLLCKIRVRKFRQI